MLAESTLNFECILMNLITFFAILRMHSAATKSGLRWKVISSMCVQQADGKNLRVTCITSLCDDALGYALLKQTWINSQNMW